MHDEHHDHNHWREKRKEWALQTMNEETAKEYKIGSIEYFRIKWLMVYWHMVVSWVCPIIFARLLTAAEHIVWGT